jgi:AcrR family transcriptional regulator
MPRPSRNIDQALIDAALLLLPETGVRALSIRQIAEQAGVNLGMFHYHFKTKDVFVRAVLQQTYDGMFASLALEAHHSPSPIENLRGALTVLARFARDNRFLLARLIGDALGGDAVAAEFLRGNVPRHIGVIAALIEKAQKDGVIRKMPLMQAIAFIASAVGAPVVLGTAAITSGLMLAALTKRFEREVLSNAAIAERIEMALTGLAAAPLAAKAPVPKLVRKSGGRK